MGILGLSAAGVAAYYAAKAFYGQKPRIIIALPITRREIEINDEGTYGIPFQIENRGGQATRISNTRVETQLAKCGGGWKEVGPPVAGAGPITAEKIRARLSPGDTEVVIIQGDGMALFPKDMPRRFSVEAEVMGQQTARTVILVKRVDGQGYEIEIVEMIDSLGKSHAKKH